MSSPPQRIASLLASSTELLYALGLGERVVAISHECDFPPQAMQKPRVTRARITNELSSRAIDDQVRETFSAGGSLYEIDSELLTSLQPDLIVTQAQCDVCAVRYADVIDLVDSQPSLRGTPVVALNPSSLDEIFGDIRQVAAAAGVRARGDDLIDRLESRVRRIREKTTDIPSADRPRVACIEWLEPMMIAANWIPELVKLAGGDYRLARPGVHSVYGRWEDVIAYDPQVLAVMPCGFDLARTLVEAPALRQLPGWEQLSAVRDEHVHLLDGNAYFNRSGPRMVESLEILAHLIQPASFDRPKLAEPWDRVCRLWK